MDSPTDKLYLCLTKFNDIMRYVTVFLLILSLNSCVRDVILDAGERAVVVDCILTDSLTQNLHLSFTKGASQMETDVLDDAVATLFDLTDGVTAGEFVKSLEKGLWTLDYSAIQGHDYRLEVMVPGYDLIYAETEMPVFPKIETTLDNNWVCDDGTYDTVLPYRFHSFSNSVWIYGKRTGRFSGKVSIMEGICTDLPTVNPFNLTGLTYFPPSKEEYNNYKHETEVTYLNRSLENAEIHKRYLHVKEGYEPCGQYFIISFPADDLMNNASYTLYFDVVSKSYDKYLQELWCYVDPDEKKDLSTIYLRDEFYTNIIGGTGIFGSRISRKSSWYAQYESLRDYELWGRTYEGYL